MLWRLDTPELAAAMNGSSDDQPDEQQQELEDVNARLDELATAYADGSISMREWMTAREPLQHRQEGARRKMATNTAGAALGAYVGHGGALRDEWGDLSIERRHSIISAVLADVVVRAGRRGYNRFDPERFELVWRH